MILNEWGPLNSWGPATQETIPYANLWTPIRGAKTEPVSIRASARVALLHPIPVERISTGTDILYERVEARSRVGVEEPTTGAMPPTVSVRTETRVTAKKPSAHANAPEVRNVNQSRVSRLPPIPTVIVKPISVRAKSYYSYWEPEAVQNLPEEILMFL